MNITVLVCDDQALVRAGFVKLLEGTAGVAVVGEASDGVQAVEQARRTSPDVVLMDIRMPRMDGIAATRQIVAAGGDHVHVLILTTFGLDDYVFDALAAGASGFLLKDSSPEDLVAAIRVVARGDALLDPMVTRSVVAQLVRHRPVPHATDARIALLTARELDTLRLVAQGLSNAEIADSLTLSEATVKTHVGHVLSKLAVRDRVQAVIVAHQAGVVGT